MEARSLGEAVGSNTSDRGCDARGKSVFGQVGFGAEEFLGVGGEGDVFGEPEDGQDHGLYAAGIGGNGVELIDQGDGAARAVDKEVVGLGEGFGLLVLVEEALEDGLVGGEVVECPDDDGSQQGGVDEVGEMDDAAGVGIYGDIACGVEPMGGIGRGGLLADDVGEEVAVGNDAAL